jgi:hypothetical protein
MDSDELSSIPSKKTNKEFRVLDPRAGQNFGSRILFLIDHLIFCFFV